MELKYSYNDGGRSNTHFKKKTKLADCVFRSIAIATNQEYLKVWNDLFSKTKTKFQELS